VLALAFFACAPKPRGLSLDLENDDIVIVAGADAKNAITHVTKFLYEGQNLPFYAVGDASFYIWRLKRADFQHPDGTLLTADELNAVEVTGIFESARSGADAGAGGTDSGVPSGSCGRCLVPTLLSPQIVNDGDLCAIPSFAQGALYTANGDSYQARKDDAAAMLVETARQSLVLAWPNACACTPPNTDTGLEKIDVVPIAPVDRPYPIDAFAEAFWDPTLLAGFAEGANVLFGIDGPTITSTTVVATSVVTSTHALPKAAIGLRSGGFLVASEPYNERFTEGTRIDRYTVVTDANGKRHLSAPTKLANTQVKVESMRYLHQSATGGYSRYPLYLIGTTFSVANYAPAMLACDEDINCQSVNVGECEHTAVNSSIGGDIQIMPDGTGIGVADKGIFLKLPNTSTVNPGADDVWNCIEPASYPHVHAPPGSPSVAVDTFSAVAHAGNRAFICATTSATRQCGPTSAVVLTSTVTKGSVDWRVLYTAPDGVYCHRFLEAPGNSDRVRLLLNNGDYVDFDSTGAMFSGAQIGDSFPPKSPGWFAISSLPSGNTIMQAYENGLYWAPPGGKFGLIYGTSSGEHADYHAIVPTEDGFFAFGNPDHLVEVIVPPDPPNGGPHPDPQICTIPWSGALAAGDHVRAAVRDTTVTDQYAVLVAGYTDASKPLLRRVYIVKGPNCTTAIRDLVSGAPSRDVDFPPGLDGIAFTHLAEIGAGRFAVLATNTRLFSVSENEATEVALAWDLPQTAAVEMMPTNDADPCSHTTPPLDAWRAIDGGHGVAWAVGDKGIIFRIRGSTTERLIATAMDDQGMTAPIGAVWSGVRSVCPDRVLIGGLQFMGDALGYRSDIWEIAHAGSLANCMPFDLQRGATDALIARRMDDDTCTAFGGAPQIEFDWPDTFFEDKDNVWVGFDNGYIHRFHSGNFKVPFGFSATAKDPKGHILFGGNESRLAVGYPAGNRE
jgi:hypothetical protein